MKTQSLNASFKKRQIQPIAQRPSQIAAKTKWMHQQLSLACDLSPRIQMFWHDWNNTLGTRLTIKLSPVSQTELRSFTDNRHLGDGAAKFLNFKHPCWRPKVEYDLPLTLCKVCKRSKLYCVLNSIIFKLTKPQQRYHWMYKLWNNRQSTETHTKRQTNPLLSRSSK